MSADQRSMQQRVAAQTCEAMRDRAQANGEAAALEFANGVLSGLAIYLVETLGPQCAYETFQRLADESARPFLDDRA